MGVVEPPWYFQVSIPALLRASRSAYGDAIRARFAQTGFDDIPTSGPFVIGSLHRNGDLGMGEIIESLGTSKQAAGQLVDTLVLRGYVERRVDTADRRRLVLSLTERGRIAAEAVARAVDDVDAALAARITPEQLDGLRVGLGILAQMRRRERDDADY